MSTRMIWSLAILLGTLAPLGCKEEGPAQQAGKDADKVVRDVKDAVVPPGPGEKAGRAVDDAVGK